MMPGFCFTIYVDARLNAIKYFCKYRSLKNDEYLILNKSHKITQNMLATFLQVKVAVHGVLETRGLEPRHDRVLRHVHL